MNTQLKNLAEEIVSQIKDIKAELPFAILFAVVATIIGVVNGDINEQN